MKIQVGMLDKSQITIHSKIRLTEDSIRDLLDRDYPSKWAWFYVSLPAHRKIFQDIRRLFANVYSRIACPK